MALCRNVTGPLETGYFFMNDNSSLLVEAVGYFMPPDTDMGPSCTVTIWDGDSGVCHERTPPWPWFGGAGPFPWHSKFEPPSGKYGAELAAI
jgi:hypothetical protein